MKQIMLTILVISIAALTSAELLFQIQTNAANLEITLSGTANIDGLTPETRSGVAFFGESGFLLGNEPDLTDPLAGLQQYNAFDLNLFPDDAFAATPPSGTFDNWLRDPTLTYAVTPAPIGFFYTEDNFETLATNDAYGELYLPIGYVSGTELSGSLTLTNRTLADFGWEGGESFSLSWNDGQDSLTFNVIPEPTTLASILSVSLGLIAFRSAQRNAREHRPAPPRAL